MTIVGHQLKRERIRSLARRTRPPSLNGPRFDRASGNAFASPYQSDRRKREAGLFGLSGRFAARLIWIRSAHKRQSRSGERALESTRGKSHRITESYRGFRETHAFAFPYHSLIERSPVNRYTLLRQGTHTALAGDQRHCKAFPNRVSLPKLPLAFLVGGRYEYITTL